MDMAIFWFHAIAEKHQFSSFHRQENFDDVMAYPSQHSSLAVSSIFQFADSCMNPLTCAIQNSTLDVPTCQGRSAAAPFTLNSGNKMQCLYTKTGISFENNLSINRLVPGSKPRTGSWHPWKMFGTFQHLLGGGWCSDHNFVNTP